MKLPISYDKEHWSVRKEARLQYIKEQDNKCWHCNELLTEDPSEEVLKKKINTHIFPKEMFDYPIHLHHNKDTGLTIGAVHCKCNAVLWQYYGE